MENSPPPRQIRVKDDEESRATASYFITRSVCPACTSADVRRIYSSSFAAPPISEYLERYYSGRAQFEYLRDTDFTLERCADCGLVYQKHIPGRLLSELLYENWIHPGQTREYAMRQTDLRYFSRCAQEIMTILAFFKTEPGRLAFFDFGMGWGSWCRMARAFGCDVYGSELSQARIDHAASQGIHALSWDEIPRHAFDVINTDQIFEHLPEPYDVLRHLARALKPGGLIKIHVPGGADITRRLKIADWTAPRETKNSLHPVTPLEHINCYTKTALIKLAARAGLEPVRIPLHLQYAFATHWWPPKEGLKNCIRPIYRDRLGRGNYLYFFFRAKPGPKSAP
ncbi:MAG: class I SAM-dependent methyltransferase [Candidatus Omnitrophica bacterium]|nr:class I SAM-dependent methyltransferase [Candidatus Omnitrophota bacterium]